VHDRDLLEPAILQQALGGGEDLPAQIARILSP
jgi:hypothetical protein